MIPMLTCDGFQEVEFFRVLRQVNQDDDEQVSSTVRDILRRVRLEGDAALRDYSRQFDHVELEDFSVDFHEAATLCDPKIRESLARAARNIRAFHEHQKQNSWFITGDDGVLMGSRVRPLQRVGVYVPGGSAPLPSSVLMNVIPAQIAGVPEIFMATPPRNGGICPVIAAAAELAGVHKVYLIGGAQACAALAYGTETVPAVDKIVGPGNIFVATAKKMLYGTVDIDMIAGPSEILIIADDSANPAFLAADLLSQAEHDPRSSAILLTTSVEIAQKTQEEVKKALVNLPRREIAALALQRSSAILTCPDFETALRLANDFAPEHLELCVDNAIEYLGEIVNAGSVFLGHHTPEAVGDYFAGPNHVLPTGGTPRFFSPLSVDEFTKKVQFVHFSDDALANASVDIVNIAEAEGLRAHANAVRVRLPEGAL